MRSCAEAYLGLLTLDGLDAMNLLAELLGGDVTPEVFVNLLQEYQVKPYFCSERLCWLLQKSKHEQRELDAKLASIFGDEDQLSPKAGRDEAMTVLTQDNVEVEFSKDTHQRILNGFLRYESERFCFVGIYPNEFEGVDATGKLVRWSTQQHIGQILNPVFKSIDIEMLAEQIKKTCAVGKSPVRFKYLVAEELIVGTLMELGYDPADLPPHENPGESGLRAIVRSKHDGKYPFDADGGFKTYWDNVRNKLRNNKLQCLQEGGMHYEAWQNLKKDGCKP